MSIVITNPRSDAVIAGTVSVNVSAPGTKRINFQFNGVHPADGTDMQAPFNYNLDTTKYPNGPLTIKAIAGNGKSFAAIGVTISNAVTVPPPTTVPPPVTPPVSGLRLNGPLGTRAPLPKTGTCNLAMQTGGIGWWPKDSRPLWLKRAQAAGRAAWDAYGYHYDGSGSQVWNGVATCEDPYYTANMAGGDGLTHEQFAINHNAVPICGWQPGYTLDAINNGEADAAYKQYANYWKTYAPHIILWRPFVEFNLPNPYGIAPGGIADPANVAKFIAAWRHMVSIVSSIADNVGYIYNPDEGNRRDYVNSSYPGDIYVDYGGTDIYNWCVYGSAGQCWSSPYPVGGPASFADLINYSRGVGMSAGDGTKLWSMYDVFSSGKANRDEMLSVPGYGLHVDLPSQKPFIVCETGQVWHSDADTAHKQASFPNFLSDQYGIKSMEHMAFFMPYDCAVDYYPGPSPNGTPTGDNNWMVSYPDSIPGIGAGFTQFASDPYMKGS
jgi:hypothetical protein